MISLRVNNYTFMYDKNWSFIVNAILMLNKIIHIYLCVYIYINKKISLKNISTICFRFVADNQNTLTADYLIYTQYYPVSIDIRKIGKTESKIPSKR